MPSPRVVRLAVVFVSLLAVPCTSHAQFADSVRIAAGSRVLVRTRDGKQGEWRFERASSDSLTLRRRIRGGDLIRSIPWNEAERVDTVVVGQPSGRHMAAGALAGGFFGALATVGVAALACRSETDDGACPGFALARYGPGAIGAGVLTGAYLGLRWRPWHWSTAWRPPASPPSHDR